MNSRERVLSALNHIQPDRVPLDLGGHRSSNFSVQAYKNFREFMGMEPDTLYIYDVIQQLVIPADDVIEKFRVDVVDLGRGFRNDPGFWKDWTQHDGLQVKIPAYVDLRNENDDTWMYNGKGEKIAVQTADSLYFEQTRFPRNNILSDDFSNLEDNCHDVMWFEVGGPPAPLGYEGEDLKKRKESAKSLRESTDKAIYGLFGGNFYEAAQLIFKMDNAYLNMAAEPKLMHKFLNAMLEMHKVNLKKYLDAAGDYLDILGVGDDLGMQTGPQISTEMYRDMFKPYQKELWRYAKELKPHLKLCMHCCGGIAPLLPDIIDAGMDAINPVQISCDGMAPAELKKEFGKDITFWGGGCDTQIILPTATPQEVREHVKRNIDEWFKDGGFVFQQVHNILGNVPPENILAMLETVKEYME